MRLKIVSVGEKVLRQQARPLTIAEIRSSEIQQLIQHMRETMHDAPGVGLAAPQVGFPLATGGHRRQAGVFRGSYCRNRSRSASASRFLFM